MKFRIALAQVTASESKGDNLKRGTRLVAEAAQMGAKLLVLPENFMAYTTLDQSSKELWGIAEEVDGPFVSGLAAEARKRKLYVVVGITERSRTKGKVHNTVVMVGSDGKRIALHRKLQLFDSFGYTESSRFEPGADVEGAFDTGIGRIGLMSCYELRFPEISRILAMQGAELIVVPTGWVAGRMKEEHLHILARARALENTVFVAVASQTGRIFSGRSLVVDPFGVSVVDAGEEEGLVTAQIDLDRITRVRKTVPSLDQVRMDVYKKHWP